MILHMLEEKSAECVQSFIMVRVSVILACWLFMVVSVLIDLWSGVSTAKAMGEPLMSKGFRHTVSKITDYIRVMLFAIMFDALGICFVHSYLLPFATIVCTIAIMLIEGKSVVENGRRKKAHAADIPEIIRQIMKAVTTKQATEILEQLTIITGKDESKLQK